VFFLLRRKRKAPATAAPGTGYDGTHAQAQNPYPMQQHSSQAYFPQGQQAYYGQSMDQAYKANSPGQAQAAYSPQYGNGNEAHSPRPNSEVPSYGGQYPQGGPPTTSYIDGGQVHVHEAPSGVAP